MTYNIKKFKFDFGTMLSMYRFDNAIMNYQEIQHVKTQILGDINCIMYFPKKI